ncbi:MAG: helix-turn-helix transcriptional regulator [Oleispira sp.]|nr:helix-turn-helix transcriptional regulator [Oleispira sp.]MBL4879920.1 helix-turn-helix transcriptional regulator [Oleispira sp.]
MTKASSKYIVVAISDRSRGMMMKYQTLPKALYAYPGVEKILHDNQSCILFKKLSRSLLHQEKIATSHCFIYVLEGEVGVQASDGSSIMTRPGEMLFMPRDTYLISDFVTVDDTIELYLIFIEHDIIDVFLNAKVKCKDIASPIIPSICKLQANASISHYFKALTNVYSDLDNNRELLKLKILEFLYLVDIDSRNDITETLEISEQRKRKRNMTSLMLENYKNNLTVSDFANLSGRSLSTFNREFKRKYGKPPKQWLIEQKMFEANKLLANGSNVTNCALEVGYSNVSHFIKAYRSIHGKTPKE